MKYIIVLLFLLPVCCHGQSNKPGNATYTQKLEFGLKGPVKEVTKYSCKAANGNIPADTADYIAKITMTFDNSGNVTAIDKLWDLGTAGRFTFSSQFFGTGRDVSFREISSINGEAAKVSSYSYKWSDNYNYMIVSSGRSKDTTLITLDSNYRLVKSVFKQQDVLQATEEWKTLYKDNKILEIEIRITENGEEGMQESYQVQVVKQYDQYGNPTVIYGYHDRGRLEVKEVLYKQYKYYK